MIRRAAAALLAAAALGSCGGGGSTTPPPPPPPPASATSFDVTECLVQTVLPGRTVAILVIPDTLTLDLTQAGVFPNGRALPDPVIDYTLAMIFLDLTREPIDRFHKFPLNPPSNDRPFRASFPFLAVPQGNPPLDSGQGSGFDFRTDPQSAYVRVDRTGMPALATALIPGPERNAFNDDSPADDVTFKYRQSFINSLTSLTNALADDFRAAGVTMCARPVS